VNSILTVHHKLRLARAGQVDAQLLIVQHAPLGIQVRISKPCGAPFVHPDQVDVPLRVRTQGNRLLLVRPSQFQPTAPIRSWLFASIRLDLARAQEQYET
jgi:hypothetical protein